MEEWILRKAQITDYKQLGEISRYGNSDRRCSTPTYFTWKLSNNPIHEGMANVADVNGQIISSTTITPKQIAFRGNLIKGAEIGDTFTIPDFQRKGIFTSLVNMSRCAAIDDGLLFIYGTPNNNSLPGYKKNCNFVKVNSMDVQMLIRPINIEGILKLKLTSKTILSAIVPIAVSLFRLRYPLHTNVQHNDDIMINRLLDYFPPAIDILADKSISNYEWMIYRNKAYLDWRFIDNPDQYVIWIGVQRDSIIGFVVCKIGYWKHLRIGYIADFLTEEHSVDILGRLYIEIVRYFIEQYVDMIAAWSVKGSIYSNFLKKNGFLKAWDIPIICYNNDLGSKISSSTSHNHFTMADSDNI